MATKLYFHAASRAWPPVGTFPAGHQSTANPIIATGANTLRTMNIFRGIAQSSHAVTANSTTGPQTAFMGFFCSPPLQGNQTVGGGTMNLFAGEQESNTSMNFWINALNIYVWRPSTNTKVGVIREQVSSSLGGLEPTSGQQSTYISGITSSAISALDGDVVICEIWSAFTQSMNAPYFGIFYYDGSNETTGENIGLISAASYIELTENITFKAGPRSYGVIVG